MRVRLKSQMFFIITPLMEELLQKKNVLNLWHVTKINLLRLHFCVKSELEEQRSHKVVKVLLIAFDPFSPG